MPGLTFVRRFLASSSLPALRQGYSFLPQPSLLLHPHAGLVRRAFSTSITDVNSIEAVNELLREVQAQGVRVREFKQNQASASVISAEVDKLKNLKASLKKITDLDEAEKKHKLQLRSNLEDLLLRKFFYVPSFEIYGGVGGLYDYGPPGCALMSNLQAEWRKHFVLTENMLEVSCASLTPEIVLKTSGHVERFTDLMVHDTVTRDYYRADKLLEEVAENLLTTERARTDPDYARELGLLLATAGSFGVEETQEAIARYGVRSPNGNELSEPAPFNLMFKTDIGPTGKFAGYLRPETAQGIFVNFRRLYEYNNRRLPFGAAQIGLAFRNEIAPRAGLLRVREFPLAEIEHFVDPEDKTHARFSDIADYTLDLLPRFSQDGVNTIVRKTASEAVQDGTINNETLAYFMVRTHKFLVACGVNPTRLRFRQHLHTEMAHYATDCWDAEIHTTQGWIECVGHADRAAFDLRVHSDASRVDLSAQVSLPEPITETRLACRPNMPALGRCFRKQSATICEVLKSKTPEELQAMVTIFDKHGKIDLLLPGSASGAGTVSLTPEHIEFVTMEEKIYSRSFTPSVIEPSFGLGRIIYAILEHAYYVRPEDEQRKVLRLAPIVAPVKVGVYNVVSNIDFAPIMTKIRLACVERGLAFQEDISKTSIGRKYSRGDEIGTPFAISIDAESCEMEGGVEHLVALRERDSLEQIRVPLDVAVDIIDRICKGRLTWDKAYEIYPKFNFIDHE